MDTSALLKSFEGELENEQDMVALLTSFGGPFGWETAVPASAPEAAAFATSSSATTLSSSSASSSTSPHLSRPSGALPSTFMPPRDTSTAEDSAPTLNGKGLLTRTREGKRPDPMEFKMHADHANRMHQYEKDFGDRSEFSLACVLDGNCGVDFNTQIPEDGFGGSPESSLSSPAFGAKENFRQSQRWTQQVTTDGAPTTRSQDPRSSFIGR